MITISREGDQLNDNEWHLERLTNCNIKDLHIYNIEDGMEEPDIIQIVIKCRHEATEE